MDGLKYEVCRLRGVGGAEVYTSIVWTDVRTYAWDCANALTFLHGGTYVVLVDGKVVYRADVV